MTVPDQDPRIDLVHAAADIPPAAWAALCPAGHPFLNRDFFALLEQHDSAGPRWGWAAHHLVARAGESVSGILPLYLKSNGYGDFTGDWSWSHAFRQAGREYFPRLFTGLPHTPATGPRVLATHAAVQQALIAAAMAVTADNNLSSWHIALPDDTDAAVLMEAGLLESRDVQFHWTHAGHADFEDYLGSFTSDRRKKVRAERRRVAASGLALEVRHGHEVDPDEWPALHALYAHTFDKFDNHAVFTAAGFAALAAALGDRMVLFIARQGNDPVALSLCFRSEETLYGRYWGSRVDVDSLHFELCFYQGIAYCLRHGLRRFEPGAGGEHKISRGFVPTLVRNYHWIADERLRALIARHLARQNEAVCQWRDEAATHLPFRQADQVTTTVSGRKP